jgi:hypothetical protein
MKSMSLRSLFLVMSLSEFDIRVMLTSLDELGSISPLPSFLRKFVKNWYYFFLNCL